MSHSEKYDLYLAHHTIINRISAAENKKNEPRKREIDKKKLGSLT